MLGIALRDPVAPIGLVIAFAVGNFPAAEHSGDAGCRPQLRLCLSALECHRHRGAVATAAGYVGFGSLSAAWPSRLEAFGAGALLAMTAETMIPEAGARQSAFSGLLAAAGFGLLHASMPRHVRALLRLLERAQPAEINAHHLAHLDEDHHDIVAGAAADDDAGPPRYTAHSASGARAPGGGTPPAPSSSRRRRPGQQHPPIALPSSAASTSSRCSEPLGPDACRHVTEVNQAGCNRLHETRRTDERERPVFGRPGDLAQEAGVDPTRVSRPPWRLRARGVHQRRPCRAPRGR